MHLKDVLTANRVDATESNEEQLKKINNLNEKFFNELNLFIVSYTNYFLEQDKEASTNVLYYATLKDDVNN